MGIESWNDFNWGRPIMDYHIGPYTIREYHPRVIDNCRVTKKIDASVTQYHGYIEELDQRESWDTLDESLAGLIVRRALGPNHSQINQHFIAGINASTPKGSLK